MSKLIQKRKKLYRKCSRCNESICWKHRSYNRKGFHSKDDADEIPPVFVQCYQCQNPSCKASFNDLPENVLPYTRFFLPDFLELFTLFAKGYSAWKIYKTSSFGKRISLAIIQRLIITFKKVLSFIQSWIRELNCTISNNLETMVHTLQHCVSWFDLTRRWFRTIYPLRFSQNFNPQNSVP